MNDCQKWYLQINKGNQTRGLYKKLDPFIVFSYIKEIQKRNIDTGRGSERAGVLGSGRVGGRAGDIKRG